MTRPQGKIITMPRSAQPEFGIETIRKNKDGNYEFINLQTPQGVWKVLTLESKLMANGAALPHFDWTKNASDVYGILPIRVRYAMMRANYELRHEAHGKRVRRQLLDLFRKDHKDLQHHSAEYITYYGLRAVITVSGWDKDHPFYHRTETPCVGGFGVELCDGYGIERTLDSAIGDPNPVRVNDILTWTLGARGGQAILYLSSRREDGVLAFGTALMEKNKTDILLYGHVNPLSEYKARGVFADPKNFVPHP